jgi:hypothetical protein
MPRAEAGLGQYVYSQQLDNILGPGEDMSRLFREAGRDGNTFESSVVDAGYDGYAVPNMGMMVVLNHDVPVDYEGTRTEVNRRIEDGIEAGDPSRAGQFNRQLVEFAATGDPRAPDLFGIARTFPVLLAVGAPEQLLIMDKKVVAKVVDPPSAGKSTEDTVRRSESGLIVPVKARIPLTVDEIQSIPRQMADPVAIIRSVRDGSSGRRYGFKILIDLVKNGFPVVVIYHPSVKYETRERKHIVSQIASIYPANEESTLSEISRELTQEKLLVYYNKGKALALASKIGNKLPSLS